MLHRVAFVLSIVTALVAALPAGGEAPPRAVQVRPVVSGVLGAAAESVEPLAVVEPAYEWTPPSHVLDGDVLRERKLKVLWDPTVPAGRDIGESSGEGGLRALTPGLRRRFDGIRFDESFYFPPDTNLAVGPGTVIQAVNAHLQITDRDGRGREVASFHEFFADDGHLFDPKIYFDPLSERFFLVVVEKNDQPQQSFIHLAVSRTDRPSSFGGSQWCRYFINSRRNGAWADYPGLGMNERWLVVSANNFRFAGGFDSPFLYVIDKDELLPNDAACPSATFTGFRPPDGFTIQPARYAGRSGAAGTPLHLVSTRGGSSTTYDVWTVRDDGTGPVLESASASGTFNYTPPPDAPQLGGDDLDSGDARVTQAVFRDGLVWAVHATGCAIGELPNESCVRVVAIDPGGAAPGVVFEETFGNLDWYAFWPGIAVNADGDVVVGFQRSRGDRFLDFAYSGMRGTAIRFAPTRSFKIGQCELFWEFQDTHGLRTGDYVGLQVDPVDDLSFWLAGEYSTRMPVLGCGWATTIGRTAYAAPQAGPGPAPLAAGSAPGGPPAPEAAPQPAEPGGSPGVRPGRLQRDEGPGRRPIEE